MKQIILTEALLGTFGAYYMEKFKQGWTPQKIVTQFIARCNSGHFDDEQQGGIGAMQFPKEESLFEQMAAITKPPAISGNAHVAEPFRGILDDIFNLSRPAPTPLDKFTTEMDAEEEN